MTLNGRYAPYSRKDTSIGTPQKFERVIALYHRDKHVGQRL